MDDTHRNIISTPNPRPPPGISIAWPPVTVLAAVLALLSLPAVSLFAVWGRASKPQSAGDFEVQRSNSSRPLPRHIFMLCNALTLGSGDSLSPILIILRGSSMHSHTLSDALWKRFNYPASPVCVLFRWAFRSVAFEVKPASSTPLPRIL